MSRPLLRSMAALLMGGLALTGCSGAAGDSAPTGTSGGTLSVVASTNVWAAVATAVGGDAVTVSSVLDDPSADPHSFEASPKVKLAMSTAALVIVNGGGYDDWAVSTVESLDPLPRLVVATDSSGLDSSSADFNEHVFYDLGAVAAVANAIATQLGNADPDRLKTFTDNAAAFSDGLAQLRSDAEALGQAHPGTEVVATEPVPGYLIETLGFTDVTPPGFSEAVEADVEVSVKDLDATRSLITSRTVQLLFNNVQTSGPVTDQLLTAAADAGVGVVQVSETLPDGTSDYLAWMRSNLTAVATALG